MTEFANVTCVAPDWQGPANVTAFTTTRLGGVSQPPFDAMNLGLHVGDDEQSVVENRRRLQQSLGLPSQPHWLAQTHSTDICAIRHEYNGAINGDGSYTQCMDTVLAVLTADCLPIVISDSKGTQLAVVHAGWRGMANGIIENAMNHFSTSDDKHAWLGPAIGAERFEVGDDVLDAFMQNHKSHAEFFNPVNKPINKPGKYMADLYAIARAELKRSGCSSVSGGEHCTYTESGLFHSHRRDGTKSGRMATVAWLSPS